jgi:streptogramin lyase
MTSTFKLTAPRTLLLLAALALDACGNLTEGSVDQPIGALTLLSTTSSTQMPVTAPITMESTSGTDPIGPVTIVNIPLNSSGLAIAPDGTVWTGTGSLTIPGPGASFFHVASDDTVTSIPCPDNVFPGAPISDGIGALWSMTENAPGPGLVRFDLGSQQFQTYMAPNPVSRPTGMVSDQQGNLWLSGGDSDVVGRVDATHHVYVVANENAPVPLTVTTGGLAVSSDGQVFVSDYAQGRIGRVQGGKFVWTDLGGDLNAPSGLTVGADDAVWFVSLGHPNEVGRVDRDGSLQAFPLPDWPTTLSDKSQSAITRGPDGSFWFTLPERQQLGRVDANGNLSFITLTDTIYPGTLAFDPAGRLWFSYDGGIARVEF